MRMLLMVSNNQMALRELYTLAVDNHPAGWATSFMSGMPEGVNSITSAFEAVVYELGAPDNPDRVKAVRALRQGGAEVITHLEGRQAAEYAEELQAAGAHVISHPVTIAGVTQALDDLAGKGKSPHKRVGLGERLRRTFKG